MLRSKMVKYSLIVPVYNVQDYLHQCIESILKQTYKEFEVILVDDGSTDNSGKICDEYAQKDNRIKVVHKINAGLVSARKEGLKSSSGEFIINIDSDDWIENILLEEIEKIINVYSPDVIAFNFFYNTFSKQTIKEHNLKEGYYDKNALEKEIYPKMLYDNSQPFYSFGLRPNLWGKVFRRNILYNNQLEVDDRITLGEDAACTYPTMLQAKSLFVLNKPLYHYRYNEKSITNSYKKNMLENNEKLINHLFNKLGNNHNLNKQIYHYIAFLLFLSIFNEVKNNETLFKKAKKIRDFFSKEYYVESLKIIDYSSLSFKKKMLFKLLKNNQYLLSLIIVKVWSLLNKKI